MTNLLLSWLELCSAADWLQHRCRLWQGLQLIRLTLLLSVSIASRNVVPFKARPADWAGLLQLHHMLVQVWLVQPNCTGLSAKQQSPVGVAKGKAECAAADAYLQCKNG